MLTFLSQHTPRGPAASLLSIRNPAEGSKATLAFRLGLTPSTFADIGFKPSLLHLYQAQALSSPQTWRPHPACPCFPFATSQHPERWQAWDQYLPRHCCLSFLERWLSLTWQGLSQPTSSIASLHSQAVGSLAECTCQESNRRVGEGKAAGKRWWDEEHALASRAVPSSCLVYHWRSTSPARCLLVSSPCLRCVFTGTATRIPRLFAIAWYYPITHRKLKPLCKYNNCAHLLFMFSLSSALWLLTIRRQLASGASWDQCCAPPSALIRM